MIQDGSKTEKHKDMYVITVIFCLYSMSEFIHFCLDQYFELVISSAVKRFKKRERLIYYDM